MSVISKRSSSDLGAREVPEVLEELAVSVDWGLDTEEVDRRRDEVGPNVLEQTSGESILSLIWRQINTPLIWVLLGAATLAVVIGETIDAAVILAVVIANTAIGFAQEFRATRAIEALAEMVPTKAQALRNAEWVTIPAEGLVPGDIIAVQAGDQVSADARVVRSRNLQADEAALTGESVPVPKHPEPVEKDAPVAERSSMIHSGTLVTSGTATAVVTATGMRTQIGQISEMLEETTEVQTPLTRQITTFGKWLTVAIIVVAATMFTVGLLRGYPAVDATLAAITLAVAAIPEGLPAIITIALAVGVQQMARRRAVIRRLPAVDTLGSATVICTDKTGTLTRGEMSVRQLWSGGEIYELSGVGYEPSGSLSHNGRELEAPADVEELLRAGLLCNDATLEREGEEWRIEGDPTEGALVVAASKFAMDRVELRRRWRRLDEVPFESERQFMATLHEDPEGDQVVYLKGSPETVLDRCQEGAGGRAAEAILEQVERMADGGMRVLALARRREPLRELTEEETASGYEFLGLAAMMDPPREEVYEAIETCHEAGITVKMVTGDHVTTAAAVGRQLGILGEGGAAFSGSELARLSEEELREAVSEHNVFARVAPEHKLRLVQGLQEGNEVVVMTGDGVNDAPALKQASIGVAMGITGTDVSKESADMVLTDDNFASIGAAVEEGRRVYDNLTKAITFILPTNVGQGLLLLLAVMLFPIVNGEPLLPVQPTQALWINLVVAVALALPLAFETMEPDVMRRSPRDPEASILDRPLFMRTVGVGVYVAAAGIGVFLFHYYGEVDRGVPLEIALGEAQTLAVTTVMLVHVFYLLSCRSLRSSLPEIGLWTNPWIYVGAGALLVLQAGFVYLPIMNTLFGTVPLDFGVWLLSLAVAVPIVPLVEAEKWLRRRAGLPAS